MNTRPQIQMQKNREHAPLFASMWVTLFLVLRRELIQPRAVR